MAELKIYNSQGNCVGSDKREYSERIENYFFGGVRLYVETQTHSQAELVVFFRARESKASRAEQYYAVYRTDTLRNIFDEFTTDLRQKIEDEQGMLIQTTSEDVEIFNALVRDNVAPGTLSEHDGMDSLLSEKKQLKFGVSSSVDAVGLLQKYLDDPCQSIAIAEDVSIDELDNCDLLIELADEEFKPLGKTKELLAEKEREETFRSPHLNNSEERVSKIDKVSNKAFQTGQYIGLFLVIFLFLLVLLVLIATVTNIEAISAVEIGNLIDILTSSTDSATENSTVNSTANNIDM